MSWNSGNLDHGRTPPAKACAVSLPSLLPRECRDQHPDRYPFFDAWLAESVALDGAERATRFELWADAPAGRFSYREAEHLLLLMVAAGSAERRGERIYSGEVLATAISGFRFN
ncbi:hypothetical protein [Bradyrhizobium sp. UFLA05-112]